MVQETNGNCHEAWGEEERPRDLETEGLKEGPPSAEVWIGVTVAQTDNHVSLIEWRDGGDLCRAIVPVEAVDAGRVLQDDLDMAIPYGVRWEALIDEDGVTPWMIGRALRRRGIWTAEDLEAQFNVALQIVRGMYDREMVKLLRAAQEVIE